MNYNENLDDYDLLMTKKEFIKHCKFGMFIDYDGFGFPVKNNKINCDVFIYPSSIDKIPKDATHIIWYNK